MGRNEVSGGSFASAPFQPSGASSKSLGAVKSRINTGLSSDASASGAGAAKAETFTGYQSRSSQSRRNQFVERPKKMSFKQRRDMVKEQSADRHSDIQKTQENATFNRF